MLVVDDSRLYREGLALWLTGRLAGSTVDTVDSLAALARHLDRSLPDVVVLNLSSIERSEMLAELTRRAPLANLVVVGIDESDETQVLACAEAGACGYVTKADSLTDLVGGGVIWLLTPKIGRPGAVDAADIAEAAPIAGLAQTTAASVSKDWAATRLVAPKSPA